MNLAAMEISIWGQDGGLEMFNVVLGGLVVPKMLKKT